MFSMINNSIMKWGVNTANVIQPWQGQSKSASTIPGGLYLGRYDRAMGFAMICPFNGDGRNHWATGLQKPLTASSSEGLGFAANAVWDERERDKDRESNKINNYAAISNNKIYNK